ncbi:hypothetical protein B6I21_01510 [candidate division KSB1 bacterium 4572_119]|nr:MAG: hypothetical protein B6I21_01510 [candidate division KSB1 bacterium 4572_119]
MKILRKYFFKLINPSNSVQSFKSVFYKIFNKLKNYFTFRLDRIHINKKRIIYVKKKNLHFR